MKNMILLSNTLLVLLCSLSLVSKGQNTELTGRIKGLGDGTVKFFVNKDGVFKADSVKATNDIFAWKTTLSGPQLISVSIDHNGYSYFMGPGQMTLTGDKDSVGSYKLIGSPMQDDAAAFAASIKDLTDEADATNDGYNTKSVEEKAIVDKKRADIRKRIEERKIQFITDHPKSFFSMYLIESRTSFGVEYAEIKSLYDKLDESAKQTEMGRKLGQKLDLLLKSRIGTQMTDFTQHDINGKAVRLSSFKGKYVLVDFWASWCGPCRAENPNILKAYNAYKTKGFTVVGISLDSKGANWKKAVKEDKMPWTQLSDLKGWKNAVSADFGIQSIPSNLLIDPSGKIIARDIRGAELNKRLKQLFN